MKEYIITAQFINGKTIQRSTPNWRLAQKLMKLFLEYNQINKVWIKVAQDKTEQTDTTQE